MIILGESDLRRIIAEEVSKAIEVLQDPNKLLTVGEVSEILQVHPGHIYRIKDRIGFIKQGSSVRFKRSDVDAYINANFK